MTAIKGKRKPQRNVLYLPTEVRVEVEKIAIEISFKRGRRISDSGLFSILLKKYKSQAMKELFMGLIFLTSDSAPVF
ncbi:Uncharacterised protein [Salmonella enterica subsp. enterica serovar Typhimurium]|nr:Uncharacterised protein [Salmonella enterica subsp. enterica serovar Typhimurium]